MSLVLLLSAQLPAGAGAGTSGAEMVFTYEGRQYIESLAGGPARELATPRSGNPFAGPDEPDAYYAWSPDGRYVTVQSTAFGGDNRLRLFDSSGHELRSLTVCRQQEYICLTAPPSQASWASDADRLTYDTEIPRTCDARGRQCVGGGYAIHSLNLPGTTRRVWPHHAVPCCFGGDIVIVQSGLGGQSGDPAQSLLTSESTLLAPSALWSVERHDVGYERYRSLRRPWSVRDTESGRRWQLPFTATVTKVPRIGLVGLPSPGITLSRMGYVSGVINGYVAVRPLTRNGSARLIAKGYGPAWTPGHLSIAAAPVAPAPE